MNQDSAVRFASGDPLFLYDSASRVALNPPAEELRRYPADPSAYWEKKFADADVPGFLEIMGIEPPQGMRAQNPTKTITCAYGGLHGVTLTVDLLLRNANQLNQVRMKQGHAPLKPAILAPVPTYTFPFNHIEDNGIELIRLPRDPGQNWLLKPEQLAQRLEDIRAEGKYLVIGYYDCNPHNPTGQIREKAEIAALAEVFGEHNRHMDALDKGMHCGAHANAGRKEGKLSHRLTVLDDMIYLGLEFTHQRPASFLADPHTAQDTVVYLSVSKYGLPGIRGGLMVTNPKRRGELFRSFWQSAGYASVPGLIAATEAFSGESRRLHERDTHLSHLNAAHMHGFQLFRSLVEGANDNFLATTEGKAVFEDVFKVVHDQGEATRRLKEGIPGLKIAATPDAGFFTLLDASALMLKAVPAAVAQAKPKWANKAITSAAMIHNIFREHGAEYLKGTTCGIGGNLAIFRANFALPPRDIVNGLAATSRAVRAVLG